MGMKRLKIVAVAVSFACLGALAFQAPSYADQNKIDITGQPVQVDLLFSSAGLDSVQYILHTGTEYLRLQCNPANMNFCSDPTNLLGTSCGLTSVAPTRDLGGSVVLIASWYCVVGAPTGCFRNTGYIHDDLYWGNLPIVGLTAVTTCTAH